MSDKPLLRIINLKKRFGDKVVLDGISFDLNKGETKVIIGPSGTGKSTLLKSINRLVVPDEGEIWLGDTEIVRCKNINAIRQQIGYVFKTSACSIT